jgi:hypothetical protein
MSLPLFIAIIGEDPAEDLKNAIATWSTRAVLYITDKTDQTEANQIVEDYAQSLLQTYLKNGDLYSSLETSKIKCKFIIQKQY